MYGFQIRTLEPLRFLRAGGGAENLEIVAASQPRERPDVPFIWDWKLQGTAYDARATLYELGREFEYWTTDAGAYRIDPVNGRIEIPATTDDVLREQRLWGIPVMMCYVHRGDFALHAAAVEMASGAVLFAAPSKYGKTTLSFAFHRHGYRMLSEDLVCCRATSGCYALPGPAVVRVRTDVYDGAPAPGTHLVLARPDRVYLGLNDDRKGSSAPVPISAVVFLRESDGDVRMERLKPAIALPDLWHLTFRLPRRDYRERSFKELSRMAGAVSTWNVHRPLRLDSLDATVAIIAEQLDH
jgi:hypothetical protein